MHRFDNLVDALVRCVPLCFRLFEGMVKKFEEAIDLSFIISRLQLEMEDW
jgi:hypothetical protein